MSARQAIVTKYLAPTNCKGARVKAICDGGSLTKAWNHELNPAQNHALAARHLVTKLGWGSARWIPAGLPQKGTSWSYVFVDPKTALGGDA